MVDFIKYLYEELTSIGLNDVLSFISNVYGKIWPFLIVYFILLTVCFWRLLEKEKQPGWIALIPFYNIYVFTKLVRLPLILWFIPILNIIALIAMPYNLARQYGLKEWQRCLAIIIPFIAIPYIAFSKLKNIDKLYQFDYLKYGYEIDELDNKLKVYTDDNLVVDDNKVIVDKKLKPTKQSKQAAFLDSLEFKADEDVLVDEAELVQIKPPILSEEPKPEVKDDEMVEIEDEETPTSTAEIDEMEENLEETKDETVEVKQEIQEYEEIGPSMNAIAFGGKEEFENQSEARNDELKCPRCGSSLVGANGTCPGCGAKID